MLRKLLLYVLAPLLLVVVALVIVISLRPSTFTVTRSLAMAAPPALVYAQVEDFHAWPAWSPWAGLDPQATSTFAGPAKGVGASFHWAGNDQVGEGVMTISEARPAEHLGIDLEFIKPFAGKDKVVFDFAAKDGGTTVAWTMSGEATFLFKAMGLFMDCDKMIGDQYEQGLAKLKAVCEGAVSGGAAGAAKAP
jgi:hypothetical protein